MAFCIKCGSAVSEGAKFCANCGASVEKNETVTGEERKKVFEGEIHKCPNCGQELKSFEAVCPSCKHELRGIKGSQLIKELNEKLEKAITEKEKTDIIKNFAVPNTKEDIMEFMILASSNFDAEAHWRNEYIEDVSDGWLVKMDQCVLKAEKLGDSDFAAQIKKMKEDATGKYDRIKKKESKKKKRPAIIVSSITVLLIITALVLWFTGVIGGKKADDYKDNVETIVWNSLVFGENLPDINITEGEIVTDTENSLSLYFYDTERSKFDSYVEDCKDFGYTIDEESKDLNFSAYNADGYYLTLDYSTYKNQNKITVNLTRPKKQNTLNWDTIKLMSKLPEPPSSIGEVSSESEDYFSVYILGMNKEAYEKYVNDCMDKGFDKKYTRYDESYSASNFWGYKLQLEYCGFNTVYLKISKD